MNSSHTSYRRNAVSLWSVIFRLEGNILCAVLPLCILNCTLLWLVAHYRERFKIGFSPTGHGLLTLLVSFLVISKVNLAYDRYRSVREHAGRGCMALRELVQIAMVISNTKLDYNDYPDVSGHANDREKEIRQWRLECIEKVKELLHVTVRVLQDQLLAKHFAYNKPLKAPSIATSRSSDSGITGYYSESRNDDEAKDLDPMLCMQSLRLHLYCPAVVEFEMLEKVNLVNKLHEYTSCYNSLLSLASTQLPFPLVQMGRAFLLIWTFTIPLVVLEGPFSTSTLWSAQAFLFFLTYGFIGLELVSIKLSDPFGKGRDDVPLSGIRDATIIGIENDWKDMATIQTTISERRWKYARQKGGGHQRQLPSNPLEQANSSQDHYNPPNCGYLSMTAADADLG